VFEGVSIEKYREATTALDYMCSIWNFDGNVIERKMWRYDNGFLGDYGLL